MTSLDEQFPASLLYEKEPLLQCYVTTSQLHLVTGLQHVAYMVIVKQ